MKKETEKILSNINKGIYDLFNNIFDTPKMINNIISMKIFLDNDKLFLDIIRGQKNQKYLKIIYKSSKKIIKTIENNKLLPEEVINELNKKH